MTDLAFRPARGVLVTGASRGIGRAVAQAFAERGDRVAVHYRTGREEAEETLRQLPGEGHALVQGDLADPQAALSLVSEAIAGVGGALDVLVCNAAVAPSERNRHSVAETSYDEWVSSWRTMVDVNLLGAANVTWAVANHLIERQAPGAIVNVGSRGAFRGEPEHPAYGASKAALHAFGQSMALALAPHRISVTSVAPGFIATERQHTKLEGPTGDAIRDQSPFGRVGTPEDVVAGVVYLASPEAMWSSGTVLDINGASYLRS
ncbi:SDR family oxidoreductase [Rhodococcus sp. H29-C3]|uniref:SDR family NAD(P)-dependent oxidoreductase n=1 Tax=Rhodococcus sp. H29-C3 TaxID=3046307 RepID=UPI0024BA8816|nr:SDR family oxidoreductase [Rhodococcus sp. H29-C3]MDJ0360106.1 SDR family oxidoreductase [Rhodococcus sp. H29-C3]